MDKNTRKERNRKSKFSMTEYLAIICCAVLGALVALVIFLSIDSGENKIDNSDDGYTVIDKFSNDDTDFSSDETSNNETSAENNDNNILNYDIVKVQNTNIYTGDLVLVNNSYPYKFVDETPIVDVYSVKNNKYKLGSGEEKLFEKTILAANNFLGDFRDLTSLTNVTMVSGYVTEEEQQKKYEEYIKNVAAEDAQKWGVKPGGSDHHTALSFNLALYPSNGKIGVGEYLWLTENAHKYGFILRYPSDKQTITSVKDDNHFRYVGVPHAEYMKTNNLCLEEYLKLVKETTYNKPLKFNSESKEYFIYYFPSNSSAKETEIKIPQGFSYSISGNNIDGFIVTVCLEYN